jgi:hypothetical protein
MTYAALLPTAHDDLTELALSFGRQLDVIRNRIEAIRHDHSSRVVSERRHLVQHAVTWRFGITFVLKHAHRGPEWLAIALSAYARQDDASGHVLATMAAMLVIRGLWSTAVDAPEGHEARGGLDS